MDMAKITEGLELLYKKLEEAQYVLVGIGEEFNEDFNDIEKFPRLMAALEEVDTNPLLEWTVPFLEYCYITEHNEGKIVTAYRRLYELIKNKNYFIVTTCIDGNIEKADFDSTKIVEPCGNYKMLQCSEKCCTDLIQSNEFGSLVKQALLDGVGLDSLERPVCLACGKPLVFNNILSESCYVEEGYKQRWNEYTDWLQHTLNRKLCILELGVGMNLPNIVRWPFEKIAFYNEKASFFRINSELYHMTKELADKGISIGMNAVDFLHECVQ